MSNFVSSFNFPENLSFQRLLDHTKKIRNRSEQCEKRIDHQLIAKYIKNETLLCLKKMKRF